MHVWLEVENFFIEILNQCQARYSKKRQQA